jgi:hypothetical protein
MDRVAVREPSEELAAPRVPLAHLSRLPRDRVGAACQDGVAVRCKTYRTDSVLLPQGITDRLKRGRVPQLGLILAAASASA